MHQIPSAVLSAAPQELHYLSQVLPVRYALHDGSHEQLNLRAAHVVTRQAVIVESGVDSAPAFRREESEKLLLQ